MIISVRGEGRFTEPVSVIDGGVQDVCYEVGDALDDVEAPEGGWTPESLLERSGVKVYKLVPLSQEDVLKHGDIRSLLKEMANERNAEEKHNAGG